MQRSVHRLIHFIMLGLGVVSLAIILVGLTMQTDLLGMQFHRLAMPWVLTICASSIVLTAWMATYFRKLVRRLEAMQRVAMTDHLTGVANRTALTETLQSSLIKAALKKGHLAVLSLDLDDFKKLNDEFGHHAGDMALRVAAERITRSLRSYENVFRMGGDEFLCLIFDPDPKTAAQKVVDALSASFEQSMYLCEGHRLVTASIGVAVAEPGETWDSLLKRSDAAMYSAKRSDGPFSFSGPVFPAPVEEKALKVG